MRSLLLLVAILALASAHIKIPLKRATREFPTDERTLTALVQHLAEKYITCPRYFFFSCAGGKN